MKKRILVTSTDLMMVQFLVPHIKHLSSNGAIIDLACSNVGNRLDEVKAILSPYVKTIFELSLQRSPLSSKNIKGYKELRQILKHNIYDYIWTNEPVMSVATRLASRDARKAGCTVIYMAHGFHFYSGAPLLNWCIYYPVERLAAKFTDKIVCVNNEDFKRASTFGVKDVEYIHGIGINTERLTIKDGQSSFSIREELGIGKDDFIILSVGELNKNKNQQTILKALARLQNKRIHYLLCGKGDQLQSLKSLSQDLSIENQVHFLGYRKDVVDICAQSDVYAMPSFREGLPVSSLEAMYCGLPLVTSSIRGLVDVNHPDRNGLLCKPNDDEAFAAAIKQLFDDSETRKKMGEQNKNDVIPFTIGNTLKEVERLFLN